MSSGEIRGREWGSEDGMPWIGKKNPQNDTKYEGRLAI